MGLMDLMDNVSYVVDTPRALTHGAIANLADAVRGRKSRNSWRASGREMLESLGVLGENQDGLDMGDMAGFGAEMALDPLNLVGAGVAMKLLGKARKPSALSKSIQHTPDQTPDFTALKNMMEPPVLASVVPESVTSPSVSSAVDASSGWKKVYEKRNPSKYALEREYAPWERPKSQVWERPDLAPGEGPFYSRLERAVEALQGDRLKTPSVMKKIKAYPEGVSQEEIDWTGVADFLKGKPVVSKSDLLEHVRKNRPRVDVDYGSGLYEGYVQPGRVDGYKEDLLKLLPRGSDMKPQYMEIPDFDSGKVITRFGDGDTFVEAIPRGSRGVDVYTVSDGVRKRIGFHDDGTAAKSLMPDWFDGIFAGPESPHFRPHSGVLAHGRSTMRNTPIGKMLLGEEQQSDWLQAAKKYGFRDDPVPEAKWTSVPLERGEKLRLEQGAYSGEISPPVRSGDKWQATLNSPVDGESDTWSFGTQDEAKRFLEKEALGSMLEHRQPNAPMLDTWPDLVLKKQLYDAASDPDTKYFGLPSGDAVAKKVGGDVSGQRQFYDVDQVARANGLLKKFGVSLEDAEPLVNAASEKTVDRLAHQMERLRNIRNKIADSTDVGILRGEHPDGIRDIAEINDGSLIVDSPYGEVPSGTSLELMPESKLDRALSIIDRKLRENRLDWFDVFEELVNSQDHLQPAHGGMKQSIQNSLRETFGRPASKVAKITPEMRQEILRKGFPLMSLAMASLLGPQLMDDGGA